MADIEHLFEKSEGALCSEREHNTKAKAFHADAVMFEKQAYEQAFDAVGILFDLTVIQNKKTGKTGVCRLCKALNDAMTRFYCVSFFPLLKDGSTAKRASAEDTAELTFREVGIVRTYASGVYVYRDENGNEMSENEAFAKYITALADCYEPIGKSEEELHKE